MAESIYLHGSEDVRAAASRMFSAAETMQSAASSIQAAFESHERFLNEFLSRVEAALEQDREARKAVPRG